MLLELVACFQLWICSDERSHHFQMVVLWSCGFFSTYVLLEQSLCICICSPLDWLLAFSDQQFELNLANWTGLLQHSYHQHKSSPAAPSPFCLYTVALLPVMSWAHLLFFQAYPHK